MNNLQEKELKEIILNHQAKIDLLERDNRNLTEKLLDQDDQIKALKQKATDEAKRADVLKVENMRQRDIMHEMARERSLPPTAKRKWHEFWKGKK